MIAVIDSQRELDKIPAWVPVFEGIARAPIPPPMPLKRAQRAATKREEGAATEQNKM
ncbi:hypothetical protein V8C42DRAFT_328244 [Trichoderma barbatum]